MTKYLVVARLQSFRLRVGGPHQYFSSLPLYCIYPYLYNDGPHHTSNLSTLRHRVVLESELVNLSESWSKMAQMGVR